MTTTAPDWRGLAESVAYPTDLLIDGAWTAGSARVDVVSPIDGRVIGDVAHASAADVDRAVASARASFEDRRWAGMSPMDRKDVLIRWANLVNEHAEQRAVLTALEMGKPAREAKAIDVRACYRTLRWFGEAIDKVLDEIPKVGDSSWAMIEREPAGVVGAITPWNFPLTLETWKIAPALAVGCSMVLKPAENSPLTALYVAQLGLEAGLPEGVLNVVNGTGIEAGAALAGHMDVDIITFTGSTATGRAIMTAAAQSNMKRPYLKRLGGKGANIVFADADLDKAAATAAWSVTYNAGQMCTAGSRLLVHESVKDEVLAKVLEAMAQMRPANPLDDDAPIGAIASARQLDTIHGIVTEGLRDRGTLLMGGEPVEVVSGGSYYPPTVVDDLEVDSLLAQREVFGPVLSVLTFSTDDEAIRIANATNYGLASAVWTNDLSRARRVSKALRMGTVWVNCYEEGDLTVPFGGVKQSGFGSDKSLHAMDKFTDLKTTWIERMTAEPADASVAELRPRRRPNLAEEVATHIRDAILSGRLRPGQRIDQDAIAEELGVSRLPVREALISLDREGLVHTIPRKGSYVSRIDRDDIADHYTIFGQVAGLAAARAVARLDDDAIATLVDLHERMSRADNLAEQQRLNHEFHRTINLAAGSQRMTSMLQLLSRSLPMPYADFPPEWLDEANRQHKDILDAFRRRDTLAAQRAMEQHIHASARHAIEVLERLDFFEDE